MAPNTVEILLSINQSVKEIAKSMAPKNGSGAEATAKLSRGDVANKNDVNPSGNDGMKTNLSGASLKDIVKFLNTLSPSILALAKLSGNNIKNFTKVIDSVIQSVKKVSDYAKENKDSLKAANMMSASMDTLVQAIKKSSNMVLFAPFALLGFTIARGAVSVYIKIIDEIGKVTNISQKIRKLNQVVRSADVLVKFVMKGALLLAVCMGLGLLVAMGPTRTLILGGLGVLVATLLTVSGIILLVGLVSKAIKAVGAMSGVKDIMSIVFMSSLLIGVCLGLGYIVSGASGKVLLYGLAVLGMTLLAVAGIILLIGLTERLIKGTGAIKGVKQIIFLTLAAMGIVILSYAMGLAIDALGGIKPILYGLGIVLGTVLAIGLVFAIIGFVFKSAISTDTVMSIVGIILLTFAAMGIILAAEWLGEHVKDKHKEIMVGLRATGTIIVALVGIGFLAGRLLSNAKKGIAALAVMELLAAGAIGLAFLVMKLVTFQKENGITWGEFYINIAAMTSIIVLFGGLAAAAGALVQFIAPGLLVLAGIELLALGAIGLTKLLFNLTLFRMENNIKFVDVLEDVGAMALIVGAIGTLAAAFGVIWPFVLAGSVALLPTIKMGRDTVELASSIIMLDAVMKRNNVTWDELKKDVKGMKGVIENFGILATEFSLVVPFVMVGSRGVRVVSKLAKDVVGVVYDLAHVSKVLKEVGGATVLANVVSVDIKKIMKTFNAKNFSTDESFRKLKNIGKEYKQIAELVGGVVTVVDAISKITKVCGVVDENGNLRPVRSIDKDTGEVEYGDPVNLKGTADLISGTIRTFVENLSFGMKEVQGMYNTKEIFAIFGTLIDPITKFVEMLTKYDIGAAEGKLVALTMDENGNMKKSGEGVDVKAVAGLIAGAITSFVTELYNEEHTATWAELIYGDRTFFQRFLGKTNNKAKSVSEVAGVLGVIIEPICGFVDLLMGLKPEGDKLSKVIVDSNGNVKPGDPVDVKATATIISGLITTFVNAIYGKDGLGGAENYDTDLAEKVLKPIDSVLKIAEKMSSEKMSATLITTNSASIVLALTSMSTTMKGMDADMMTKCVDPLSKIVDIGRNMGEKISSEKILANSKSIATFMTDVVEKKLPKNIDIVDNFAASVMHLKTAFVELDRVLIKEEEKRQKALDKFGESITSILETVEGSMDSITAFKDLLDSIQNADFSNLNTNISNGSSNNSSGQQSQQGEGSNENGSQDQSENGNNQSGSINYDEIEAAIGRAFANMQISPNVESALGSDNELAILLSQLSYTISPGGAQ